MKGSATSGPTLRGAASILLAFLFAALSCASARAQSRDERAVRAAYVYNLIKYVDWPAPPKNLTIALAGDPATADIIAHLLDGKTTNGQTIRALASPTPVDLQQSSVLYVADAHELDLHRLLDSVRGRGVLTVGETDAFTRQGGMIGLVHTGDHIRIDVNLEAVQAGGLRISSRVLELATIVRTAGNGGN